MKTYIFRSIAKFLNSPSRSVAQSKACSRHRLSSTLNPQPSTLNCFFPLNWFVLLDAVFTKVDFSLENYQTLL